MFSASFMHSVLPEGAAIPSLKMLACDGRDQVASRIGDKGWKFFEPPMPELFYRLAQISDGMIIDVGANTGFYSLVGVAARKNLKVWAFEPDPHVRPILKKNLKLNRVRRRVRVFPIALSDARGSADLYVPTQEHGLIETSSSLEKTFKDAHSEVIRVPVDTIDRVMSGLRNIFRKVAIIKVDVEGHEAAVLRGATETVRKHRPLMFVEVLPGADLVSLNAFLRNHSYKDIRLQPAGRTAPGDEVFFDPDAWNHVFSPIEKLNLIT